MGVYTVWGYEGEALLLTDISVPKRLVGKGGLEFTTDVSCMVCSKTCNPGNAKVSIVLPRRDNAKVIANWRARFEKIRGQQPRRMERTWCVAATRSAETYTLTRSPISFRYPRHRVSRSGNRSASAATCTSGEASTALKSAPVPRPPHPIRPTFRRSAPAAHTARWNIVVAAVPAMEAPMNARLFTSSLCCSKFVP